MRQKAVTLLNRGMNRDLSISKVGESAAYENHNIRIVARDHDTMLSVTNERGTKQIDLGFDYGIKGTLIGWNVLNEHLILFTTENGDRTPDRIYRLDYDGDNFTMYRGSEIGKPLYEGRLGFDTEHPIESVVYHETDLIQKIYWVDGIHVLRFMNFMADLDEISTWDDTTFDSDRAASFGVSVTISKDNSGNTRANGTAQYLLTYYNKHGQETGYIWISDLVYLSPVGVGGAVDGTNNNRITLNISNLDTSFSNFRVYSIVRTSYNGTTQGYIVAEGLTNDGTAIIVDDGSHLIAEDSNRLLYLGSQTVHPGTLTHKDQTLFIGDLQSVSNRGVYERIEELIKDNMFVSGSDWQSSCITFQYSSGSETSDTGNIPYVVDGGAYAYKNQLLYSSSQIQSFKGGEKYRFALCFSLPNGTRTDAFWIGDAVNQLYPKVNDSDGTIQRVVAKCTIPPVMMSNFINAGFQTVQLMIAEATYADRSVKAQGIVSPTVFNPWNRFNNGLYGSASWLTRPRNADYANKHFEPIHKSTVKTGEIDCNYWETELDPTPYYSLKNCDTTPTYKDEFDVGSSYGYMTVVFGVICYGTGYEIRLGVAKGILRDPTAENSLLGYTFVSDDLPSGPDTPLVTNDRREGTGFDIDIQRLSKQIIAGWFEATYAKVVELMTEFEIPLSYITKDQLLIWCQWANDNRKKLRFYNTQLPDIANHQYTTEIDAFNADSSSHDRWHVPAPRSVSDGWDYTPSYFRKHLMFVDENLVTLNSPEIENEVLSFDNVDDFKFRIVGVAKITGGYSDYTVEASPGKLPGENLMRGESTDEILSWPMWEEYGLVERMYEEGDSEKEYKPASDIRKRTSYDYLWGSNIVRYWLHMWNRSGKITGYTDYDNNDFGTLRKKTFANIRYSYKTVYNNYGSNPCVYDPDAIRIFNYTTSQYVGVKVGNTTCYYDGALHDSLATPSGFKYPISYSVGTLNMDENMETDHAFLYSSSPVQLEYLSSPHAVISLGTMDIPSQHVYKQEVLPWVFGSERFLPPSRTSSTTGWILPWINNTVGISTIPNIDYSIFTDRHLVLPANTLNDGDEYVFIGEIYYDFDNPQIEDTRYGGTSSSAIQNCRFVTAGPQYSVSTNTGVIYANQGDTYFQRWDCLKTKPYSTGSVNNVIDITSVLLETHINLDGRSDLQRETRYIASIDTEKYNTVNPAYSQQNNFYVRRDLDEDFNLDAYRSTVSWSLTKTDSANIDEWSHVTLANTLKLDGDKGFCRALRRFENRLIAFQDKSISEILFNSRTQIPTGDGIPIEIANSGKVDGKHYISNKYGCINKWSITEGKRGLYFVDNINKSFCSLSGNGIEPLSTKLGFDVWFRRINNLKPWTPAQFDNLVSFYDRVHSDVYLVDGTDDDMACLVYNENLGAFTSFFDYGFVPMMVNVEDRFVSFKNNNLWFQNEGLYGDFFGEQKDFWVQYRVTPDPFGDKIWSGFDYRTDFYHVLDVTGASVVPEEYLINGDNYQGISDLYIENETFDTFKVWDEYQSTGDVDLFRHNAMDKPVTKDFRIWRRQIPRALISEGNQYGLDRIRNPWINLLLKKEQTEENNQDLAQLHDVVVRYFE